MSQPNLLTLDGQLDYLSYHAPDGEKLIRHAAVHKATQEFWKQLAAVLPDGPGKTRALHAVNAARMSCNNCIANDGA